MNSAGLRLASSSRAGALSAWKSTKCPRQLWGARRHMHTRIELPYKVEDGLGNFMSPRTLKIVSEEYQQGLLDRLNDIFPDVDQRKTVTQLVIDTASSGKDALGFSYASQALNNSFFLNCLRPPTELHYEDILHKLIMGPTIRSQFGSISHFINNFSSAARGMSGSGYIWLITDSVGNLAIQPTFAAGTLLVRSRACTENPAGQYEVLHEGRLRDSPSPQSTHLNSGLGSTPTSPTSGMSQGPAPLHPSAPVRTLHMSHRVLQDGTRSIFDKVQPVEDSYAPNTKSLRLLGEKIYPLFCVSIHEHCWLLDHGVWGKEKYMKELWNVLDWNKVNQRYIAFKGANTGSQPLRR